MNPHPTHRPITGIDHALLGVRDLEAARGAWERLGFTVTPRGRHIGWGTANYCIMLAQGYIELIGVIDPAAFTNDLDRFLEQREGLLGLAFATDDAATAGVALAARGLHPEGPKGLKRRLELPGGDVLPAFSLLFLPPEEAAGLRVFLCQHLTPDLIRRPAWLRHRNGATALAEVTVVVDDPGAATAGCARLVGPDAASIDGDAGMIETGAGRLRFITPDGLGRRYPADLLPAPLPPPPWIAAMTLATAAPSEAGILAANGTLVELVAAPRRRDRP